ncbi:male gametophyte defective 3 [Actinidia rufa]|uniref:Male gametophyte defective 3 n=1 Tax=Actinidia rufa TaxID=165716 RepID=A0A7J0ELL9_9ERIC|nr:male gametophyte defective 3 [Actinidia rufa]
METKETPQETPLDIQESNQFVDYKDRKKVMENQDAVQVNVESGIEKADPGLIRRKQKQVEKANVSETKASEQSTSSSAGAEIRAEDAVAMLLKHKRGVLGPERPSFLGSEMVFESWVPPEGQSGDGRTSLHDRLGFLLLIYKGIWLCCLKADINSLNQGKYELAAEDEIEYTRKDHLNADRASRFLPDDKQRMLSCFAMPITGSEQEVRRW